MNLAQMAAKNQTDQLLKARATRASKLAQSEQRRIMAPTPVLCSHHVDPAIVNAKLPLQLWYQPCVHSVDQ